MNSGERVISHEEVRQQVLRTGEVLDKEQTGVERRRVSGNKLWDKLHRRLASQYETLVVINGDESELDTSRETFGDQAMYQCDRFHVTRDVREVVGELKRVWAGSDGLA